MARPNAPWYGSCKDAWYATVDGKKVSLGIKGEKNKAEALKAWHKILANGKPEPTAKAQAPTVAELVSAFLADAQERVSAGCLRNYRIALEPFAQRFGSRPADAMTVKEAEAYARRPDWSASYRNGMLGALLTAYRFAESTGRRLRLSVAGFVGFALGQASRIAFPTAISIRSLPTPLPLASRMPKLRHCWGMEARPCCTSTMPI